MDNKSNNDETWIPEGFVEVLGPTGEKYLVPEFYAPALRNTLDAAKMKSNLGIENYNGTVSLFFFSHFSGLAGLSLLFQKSPGGHRIGRHLLLGSLLFQKGPAGHLVSLGSLFYFKRAREVIG